MLASICTVAGGRAGGLKTGKEPEIRRPVVSRPLPHIAAAATPLFEADVDHQNGHSQRVGVASWFLSPVCVSLPFF
eukprot:SAG31_NODE_539_length_14296_cov_14.408819_1_plen_76_part_00